MKKILVLTVSLFLVACGGERSEDSAETETALNKAQQNFVEDQMLPNVRDFLNKSKSFESDVNSFCGAVDNKKLVITQNSWKDLSLSWHKIEPFLFGPTNDHVVLPKYEYINSFRTRGTNFSSTVRDDIKRYLSTTGTITFKKSPKNVGLLMLEVLLFETSATYLTENASIVTDFGKVKKCTTLKFYTNLVKENAQYIDNGWNIEHHENGVAQGKSFKEIYLSGMLTDSSKSIVTLLVSIQQHLDNIKKRKTVANTAKLSGISYQNALSSIESIEKVLEGTAGKDSLFSIMKARNNESTVNLLKGNIQIVKTKIAEKNQVDYEAATSLLDGNFKREIPLALNISLGINFSDGD